MGRKENDVLVRRRRAGSSGSFRRPRQCSVDREFGKMTELCRRLCKDFLKCAHAMSWLDVEDGYCAWSSEPSPVGGDCLPALIDLLAITKFCWRRLTPASKTDRQDLK
jgi:hypothetical protein